MSGRDEKRLSPALRTLIELIARRVYDQRKADRASAQPKPDAPLLAERGEREKGRADKESQAATLSQQDRNKPDEGDAGG